MPVFVVLTGLNATTSIWRRGEGAARGLCTRRYLLSRVDRLVVPFLAACVAAAAFALARGSISIAGVALGWVAGIMPLSGPGNSFIPFTFQFAVLFPLYMWCYRRRPELTTAAAFVLALAFELAAAQVSVFDSTPILYSAAFASAFYPALLVVAGLRWLPRAAGAAPGRLLAALGVASYEIFLVQMAWFALFPDRGAIVVLDILACCAIGYALHVALRRVPPLAGRRAQPAA